MLKVTVKRVDIFSIIKWRIVTALISGILIGGIYFGIAFYNYGQSALRYGFYYFIGIPLIYCIVTAAGSLVGGILYNSFSDAVGGIKFEAESENTEENLPPPPKTWT